MTFRNQQLILPILSIPSNRYVHNICHICQTTQTAELEPDSRIQIFLIQNNKIIKSLCKVSEHA